MNFSYADLVSINEILADVLRITDDERMRMRNKGWYTRQVKEALEKLAFATFFDVRYDDITIPDSLIVPMPKGSWNIRDIFVYNGDCCVIDEAQRVFYKPNFLTKGTSYGHTARNKQDQDDSFISSYSNGNEVLFYNVQNGDIMLSDACADWDGVRIVYNGIGYDLFEAKIVPPFAREAVIGYVVERFFFSMKATNPQVYRVLWNDAKIDLYGQLSRSESSRWDEAKYNLKAMDKKQRDDFGEYLSKMRW